MRYSTKALAFTLALAVASTAAAKTGDVMPKDGKSILFWSPAEQAAGYRRIEDLFPTHVIHRGTKVHPLPKSDRPEPKLSFTVPAATGPAVKVSHPHSNHQCLAAHADRGRARQCRPPCPRTPGPC